MLCTMKTHLLVLAALLAAPLAQAETATSSASSAGSAAVGSLSNSMQASSNSSNQRRVAAGDYRIERMAAAGDGHVLVDLAPLAGGGPFTLRLPQAVAERQALAVGGVVTTEARDYGYAFAQAGQPFFLAVADDWHRGLDAKPV